MMMRTVRGSRIARLVRRTPPLRSLLRSPLRPRHVCLACLTCFIAFPPPARGGTIFDEDWTPPKPVVRQHVAAAASTAAAATTTPSATRPAAGAAPEAAPAATPASAPEPGPRPSPRRPVPASAEQAHSRGLLKAAFEGQLKDRSLQGRKKLAAALLEEVPRTADNASDQYVLLGGAIEASREAGDLGRCFQAADLMASQYEVDALAVKTDAALKTGLRGDSPAATAENVRAALELMEPLLEAEDFAAAARVLALARPAAAGDPELGPLVQQRGKVVEALRAAHDRLAPAVEKLRTSPDDSGANLAVGSYLCFNRGEWEKGLPMLAKGSDAGLKQLAALEVARPKTPAEALRLADGWWDAAARQPDSNRAEALGHAISFYKGALEGASGLQRTYVEHRIADASAAREKLLSAWPAQAGRAVRLLRLIDPEKDTVQGKFAVRNGELVTVGQGQQRIEIPYRPPKEYDYRVEFTRGAGNDAVIQILSKDGIPFIWVMQDDYIFHYLKNGSPFSNGTKVKGNGPLKSGVRYTSVVQVRNSGVRALLNGQLIADWKTDYKDINPDVPFWALRDKSILGIGIGGTGTVFHSADIVEVTGNGSKTR